MGFLYTSYDSGEKQNMNESSLADMKVIKNFLLTVREDFSRKA